MEARKYDAEFQDLFICQSRDAPGAELWIVQKAYLAKPKKTQPDEKPIPKE